MESQKRELDATETELKKVKTVNDRLQKELEDVRAKAEEREAEIEELYDLQDKLEQYTRKQSLAGYMEFLKVSTAPQKKQ